MSTRADAPDRLPRIEAMRGIAALSVFAFHSVFVWDDPAGTPDPQALWRRLGLTLDVGVTIFFVISGLLLFGPFARALVSGRHLPDVRAYAWRRFLRVVPAYWAALLALVVLSQREQPLPGGIVPYALFAQNYSTETWGNGIGQAWTLNVEVTFYALLPLLAGAIALAVGRRATVRGVWAALGFLVAASLAWKLALTGVDGDSLLLRSQWLPWHLDVFAVGMAFALLLARGAPRLGPRAVAALLVLGALALVIAATTTHVSQKEWWALNLRQLLYTVAAASVMAVAVFAAPGRVDRVLRWRPLVLAGVVSYSIYLLHLGVMTRVFPRVEDRIGGPAGDVVKIALALALTLAAATVLYRFVEKPALSLKRLVPDRRPRGAPPVGPAADVPAP